MNNNPWCLRTSEVLSIVRDYYLETGNPVVDGDRLSRLRLFQQVANEYVMYKFVLEESVSFEGGFMVGSYEIKNQLLSVGLSVDHHLLRGEYDKATSYPLWKKFLRRIGLIKLRTPAKSYIPSEEYKRVLAVISTWKEFMDAVLAGDWGSVQPDRQEVTAFLQQTLPTEGFEEREFETFLENAKGNHFFVLSRI